MANSEASKYIVDKMVHIIMDECDDYKSAGTLMSLLSKDLIQRLERVQAELEYMKEKTFATGKKNASVDAAWKTIYT